MTCRPPLRWTLVLLFAVLCALAAARLDIRQNVQDMLPDSIARGELRLLSRLGLIDRVFITVEGPDFKTVSESTGRLGELLSRNSLFSTVIYRVPEVTGPEMLEWVMNLLPAITGGKDLEWMAKRLSPENLHKILQEDFLLVNSPVGAGFKSHIQRDPLGFVRLFFKKLETLKTGSRMGVRDGMFCTEDGRACMLWAESRRVLTDSGTAEEVQSALDAALKQALLPGTHVTVIGTLPHTLANARMVNGDLKLLLTLATLAIILLFWLFTRDIRSLSLVFIPLMSAPFAILAAGAVSGWKVSGIALGFGVVLIGIAIDFSVHIYMHFRGRRQRLGLSDLQSDPVLRSIFMAYLTTAGVFIVLIFSRIPAHRQMAFMALAGLSIALLLALLLVPDIAGVAGGHKEKKRAPAFLLRQGCIPCMAVITVWVLVTAAGVMAWSRVGYNGDIRQFDVRTPEITHAERHFHTLWGTDPDQVMVVAAGRDIDQALDLNDEVYTWLRRHGISRFRSISSLLPGHEKQKKNIQAWQRFWGTRLAGFEAHLSAAALSTGFSSSAFAPFIEWFEAEPQPVRPGKFLNTPAGALLSGMIRFGGPTAGTDAREVFVITMVPGYIGILDTLKGLTSELPEVHLFSGAGWKLEMEDMMRSDIRNMCLSALLLVTCITWLFFRNMRLVAAALVPVVSALSALALFTMIAGGSFNMMHLLMGIMVTGLSIDYGIFMVCAVRDGHTDATIRAVILCALSTLSGFGILVLAHHPVLESLGETVLAGIGASLPAALFVTPCVMKAGVEHGKE